MDFLAITKKAVTVVVGFGVSKIVSDIVTKNVEIQKPHELVTVSVASIAIGGVVADAASSYTDSMIDQIADAYNEIFKKESK